MIAEGRTQRDFAVRVAFFYGALFVFYGTHTPFMPVWLDWRGLSSGEISTVIAAPLLLRFFLSPVVAMAADREAAHRRYSVILAWLCLAFVLVLAASQSFGMILLFATLLMLSNSTIMPLVETIAVDGVRHRGLDYGRMRLWGSLTFVGASFAGGLAITAFGGGAGIWLIALGCALTVAAGHFLPRDSALDHSAEVPSPFWRAAALRDLLFRKDFLLFLVAAGLAMSAHATFFTFGVLIWQGQGLSGAWCGVLWAIGVFAEVLLFSVSGHVVRRMGASRLLVLGASASIVRWLGMAFDPSLAAFVPLQILHGLTYGATHIGAIHFIHERVAREKQGTAQALYATMAAGIAMAFSTLIAGWFYASGGSLSYLAMVAISTISLAAGLLLLRAREAAPSAAATADLEISPKAPAPADA